MLKRNGRIVGVSYVHNYIHRPKELDDVSLYDWISTYKRGRLLTKKRTKSSQMGTLDDKAVEESDCKNDVVQDELADNNDDEGPGDTTVTGNLKGILHFTADHPLFATHGLKHLPSPLVPNFVGQMLPRCDQIN